MRRRLVPLTLAAALGTALTAAAPVSAAPGLPHQAVVLGINLDGTPELPLANSLSVDNQGDLELAAGANTMRMTPQGTTLFTETTPQLTTTSYVTDSNGNGYVSQASTISVIDGQGNVTHTIPLSASAVTALVIDPSAPDLGGQVMYVLDAADSLVEVIDPALVDLSAGDADIESWTLPAAAAQSIAIGPDHTVFIGDGASGRIWHYTDQGIYLGSFVPSGGDQGAVQSVAGLAIDSAGTVFIPDTANHRIVESTTSGSYLGMFGSSDPSNGSNPGTGQFDDVARVAVDCLGNLWVLDEQTGIGISRLIDYTGVAAPTGTCAAGPATLTAKTTQAAFVGVDRADDVYASSYGRVEKFDAGLHLVTSWGQGQSATPGTGHFGQVNGIAVSPTGDVFVSTRVFYTLDATGNVISTTDSTPKVLEFHATGTFVREFTSEPNAVTGGPASPAFIRPASMAFRQSDGHLFVADTGLGEVLEFDASLHFVRTLTLAAVPGGTSTTRPTAIAFDPLGRTVVAVAQRQTSQSSNYFIVSYATDLQRFNSSGAPVTSQLLPTVDEGGLVVTGLLARPDGNFNYATTTQMPGTATRPTWGGLLDNTNLGPDVPIAPALFNGPGTYSAVTDCAGRPIAPSTTLNLVVVVRTSTARCIWLPTATTGSMTKHTSTSITVTASSNPSGQVTKMRVLYGATTKYGKATVWVTLPSDNTVQTRTFTISGLLAAHYYHYRVQVQNNSGTVTGSDRIARTL